MSTPISAMMVCATRTFTPGMVSRRSTIGCSGAISTSMRAVTSSTLASSASIRASMVAVKNA